jgi:glyoxalase family protein
MLHPILGLHHVTATVDDAQDDVDLVVRVLGLRLVKKTVNFDNHHVYHFYYGDEHGTPGTLWTTFPYKGRGVPSGREGAGQVTVTSFAVPAGSLAYWRARLAGHSVATNDIEGWFDEAAIGFSDASGLRFELVASRNDRRAPWDRVVEHDAAIRGLHSVTMVVRELKPTLDLMTGLLGFKVLDEAESRTRVGVHGGGPGRSIDILVDPAADPAMNGLGTVHHVALAVASGDEQARLRKELVQYGCRVTEVRDRCYFTSIYFREPGGVLFEVATNGPGFLIDEPLSDLGRSLKLPSWEEPHRGDIEAHLAPLTY